MITLCPSCNEYIEGAYCSNCGAVPDGAASSERESQSQSDASSEAAPSDPVAAWRTLKGRGDVPLLKEAAGDALAAEVERLTDALVIKNTAHGKALDERDAAREIATDFRDSFAREHPEQPLIPLPWDGSSAREAA